MSSAFSSRRLTPQDGMDIVFCHSCGHEWHRSAEDTSPPPSCPRCDQDIVEIVTRENDPRTFQQTVNAMGFDTLFNLGGLGSAGPSYRMPLSRDRDPPPTPNLHSRMANGNGDEDFTHDFHNHLHRHFHDSLHSRARRGLRPSHVHVNGDDHGHGHHHDHDRDHNRDHDHSDEHDDDEIDSDPEEADIDEHEFHGPNNLYMYRTVTTNFGAPETQPAQQSQTGREQARTGASRRPGATDPSDAESMFRTFTQFFHGFRDNQAGRSGPDTLFFSNNGQPGTFGSARQTTASPNTNFGATSFTIATGPMRPGQAGGAADFNTVLGNIMGNIGPPDVEEQNPRAAGNLPPGFPAALHQILLAILSRDGSFQQGDAVHSEEALDRIISMLMETNPQTSGAPPASQNALDELERKKVDMDMLGPEGHAECTICITDVELNEEVLLLPCKHWFHEECAVMWLKQHNTCPVCRHPVVSKTPGNANRPSNSAAGPGPAAAGGGSSNSNTDRGSRGNGGSNISGGGAAASNANGGSSLFGSAMNSLSLPRGFFAVNITGSNNLPGPIWGPGITDPELSRSSNSNSNSNTPTASTAANESTATSSSSSPNPHTPNLRQRLNQEERFNAIRSAAGLPPTGSSAGANPYRSPRISERSVEAERERRRRDSHSPNPGHNIPSRRFNAHSMPDFDDWRPDLDSSSTRSRNWPPLTQNNGIYRSHFWGAVGGPDSNPSPNTNVNTSTTGPAASASAASAAAAAPSTTFNRGQNSWDRRRPSISRRGSVQGGDNASGSTNVPRLSRSSTRQSRRSVFADPAPDAAASGRPYAPWMPGSYSAFGGDGHSDAHGHDEPRSSDTSGPSRDRGNSTGSNAGASGGGGGSGGLFSFFRRRQ